MLNNQLNFKFCESQRIYLLAWQQSPQQFQKALTPDLLQQIYRALTGKPYPYMIENNNLNIDFFSKIISFFYQPTISSFEDLTLFQQQVSSSFSKLPERPVSLLNRSIYHPNLDEQSFSNYLEQLDNMKVYFETESQSQSEVDIKIISEWLFAIYVLNEETFANYIVGFKKAMNRLFFSKLDVNKVSNALDDYFKCLLFICEAALSYPQINNEIIKSRYFQSDEFKTIYSNSFEKMLTSYDYLSISLLGFTNAYLLLQQQFAVYLSVLLVRNQTIKKIKTNMHKLLNQTSILKQYMYFFTELLKIFFIKKQSDFQYEHMYDLQELAISVLTQVPTLQTTAMGLINEIVKYNLPPKFGQDSRIAFSILQRQGQQLKSALLIWQTALAHRNKLFTDTVFIERQKYINLLETLLGQPFEADTSFHIQCLQIIQLMINPLFNTCFEKFLNCLGVALLASPLLSTFVSQIIKKLSLGLHQERNVFGDFGEKIHAICEHLLRESIKIDENRPTEQRIYIINKIIIANSLQSLYILFSSKSLIRKGLNPIRLISLYELLLGIIKNAKNPILDYILRSTVITTEDSQMRLYGLIFFISENILFLISNSDQDRLKQMAGNRQLLLAHFYELLSPQELKHDNIPIMVAYYFSMEIRRKIQFKRYLPISLPFAAFKAYLLTIVQTKAKIEDFDQIYAIKFLDIKSRYSEIKSQSEYKAMIDRIRKGNSEYNYYLKIQQDIPPVDLNSFFVQKRPANSYNSTNTRYTTQNSPLRSRNATQISRTQRPLSPSLRTSSFVSRKCEICGQSSPSTRFCRDCNHL